MKKTFLNFALLTVFLSAFSLTSCEKDEDEPDPTKTELISGNNWVLVAENYQPARVFVPGGTQENNSIPYYAACELDDFINFNANGTFTIEEGPSKCDVNDPQTIATGVWVWNSDETRVILTSNGQSVEFNITTLTANSLVVTTQFVENGVTFTITSSYN